MSLKGRLIKLGIDTTGDSVDIHTTSDRALELDGVAITATATEINTGLDGVTATAAELNTLDGITSTTAELNILDTVTSTAAELNILDGVTSTAAELNILDGVTATAVELNEAADNVPTDVTFAFASAAANVSEITITAVNAADVAVAEPLLIDVWLSDAATGLALTGTAASGTVTSKAASGADWLVKTAKKAIQVQTLATGVHILEITDSAKTAYYVCATIPGTGKVAVSAQMASGDYGA